MKANSKSILILTILFGYILLQFLWWEVLLVRQNNTIINEKQKLMELSTSNELVLNESIQKLHHTQQTQTIMIVCEGTVFLLLLLFGMYKVKKAIDREADLNTQQHNFFLSITHELKTPIAATKLQLQTLLKQKLDVQTQTEIINAALEENNRLNLLIDNVLLASRLENSDFTINLSRENLSECVQQTVSRYYKSEITKAEIVLDIAPDLFCLIDSNIFTSVITNLIDNAIKYSSDEKKINIQLLKKENNFILKITDSGFGIADADKQKIFERFYRVGSEETRKAKGTGLGLYIVQNIVNKHNATIKVNNNQPKGSIFEIQLNGI